MHDGQSILSDDSLKLNILLLFLQSILPEETKVKRWNVNVQRTPALFICCVYSSL